VAIDTRPEKLAPLIFLVRGEKVLLDSDLAMLYGVQARALNQAVARNRQRFPADFMFQLSTDEYEAVRATNSSQTVMSSGKRDRCRGLQGRRRGIKRRPARRRKQTIRRSATCSRGVFSALQAIP